MLDVRKDIISFFKKGIFPYKGNAFNTKEEEKEEEAERNKKFIKYIQKESKDINYDFFKKHFYYVVPSALVKDLYKIKNREKNNMFVSIINSRLSEPNEEIKEMFEEERKIEKPDKIVKIVKDILKSNKQKQEGEGLKILTPRQMLSRLPIYLAQLGAENNSKGLKNERRQFLYSLYRSKNMRKQVYNNLVKHI